MTSAELFEKLVHLWAERAALEFAGLPVPFEMQAEIFNVEFYLRGWICR